MLPSSYANLERQLDFEDLARGIERTFVVPLEVGNKVWTYGEMEGGRAEAYDEVEGIRRIREAYAGIDQAIPHATTAAAVAAAATTTTPSAFELPTSLPAHLPYNPSHLTSNLLLPSPYPVIDMYVQTTLSRLHLKNGLPSTISTYGIVKTSTYKSVSPYVTRLSYNMRAPTGGGYCYNVGRWHKSNSIIYQVDVEGTAVKWRQMCFDADCRGFRSEWVEVQELRGWWEEVRFEREVRSEDEPKTTTTSESNFSLSTSALLGGGTERGGGKEGEGGERV